MLHFRIILHSLMLFDNCQCFSVLSKTSTKKGLKLEGGEIIAGIEGGRMCTTPTLTFSR